MKIGRYNRDLELVETRDLPDFAPGVVGSQTIEFDPPLVCEKGDYLAEVRGGRLIVRPAEGTYNRLDR